MSAALCPSAEGQFSQIHSVEPIASEIGERQVWGKLRHSDKVIACTTCRPAAVPASWMNHPPDEVVINPSR